MLWVLGLQVTMAAAILAKASPSCENVKCAPINCQPPFVFRSAAESGMCCGTCWSDEITVPEDRSWAETLSGGIGMDPNADPTACRNVVCLAPDCEAFDQVFDGRCCTKCKSSVSTVSAADRRAELGLIERKASPSCDNVKCAPINCQPPFVFRSAAESGMCCGTCWSDEITVPEDRSWAETLSGGIGMDPNADPTQCRNVVCLAPDCEAFDQVFDGRCCTKCKSSVETKSAADYRGEMNLLTVHRAQERKEGPMECVGVECAPLNCQPPFTWKSATDAGTCCPLCWSDEVVVPEDRSWAKGLTGGIGMDPNA